MAGHFEVSGHAGFFFGSAGRLRLPGIDPMDQFKTTKTEIVLSPAEFKTGEVQAPYSEVKK